MQQPRVDARGADVGGDVTEQLDLVRGVGVVGLVSDGEVGP